jgi:hypothetical protein
LSPAPLLADTQYESGGTFFVFLGNRIMVSAAVMVVFTGCVMMVKSAFVQATLLWVLGLVIIYVFYRCVEATQLQAGQQQPGLPSAAPGGCGERGRQERGLPQGRTRWHAGVRRGSCVVACRARRGVGSCAPAMGVAVGEAALLSFAWRPQTCRRTQDLYVGALSEMPLLVAQMAPRARIPATVYVPPPLQQGGWLWYPEVRELRRGPAVGLLMLAAGSKQTQSLAATRAN